jgi:hypothetical protein
MSTIESSLEVRPLTNQELEQVDGGSPLILAAAVWVGSCMLVGLFWDNPVGSTQQQAASALGLEHLL